jgi:hypothetical protein
MITARVENLFVKRCIAVLEDNDDRIAAMQCLLADKFPFFDHLFSRTASDQITWLQQHAERVICLCLDHDLEPPADRPEFDPGTGRDVVEFLNRGEPAFPVIVHTTNAHAGLAMTESLHEHGWTVRRVMPYDDVRWIAEAWLPTVRQAIVDAAQDVPELAAPSPAQPGR